MGVSEDRAVSKVCPPSENMPRKQSFRPGISAFREHDMETMFLGLSTFRKHGQETLFPLCLPT